MERRRHCGRAGQNWQRVSSVNHCSWTIPSALSRSGYKKQQQSYHPFAFMPCAREMLLCLPHIGA
eukprot:366107-Chlamydomonas_euryale.AAC.2